MKDFDKYPNYAQPQLNSAQTSPQPVRRSSPLRYRSARFSHITEITEQDDSKFQIVQKKNDQIRILSDMVELETLGEKGAKAGPWRLLECLQCLSFMRLTAKREKQGRIFTNEKEILRELNFIRQEKTAPLLPAQTGQPRKTLVLDLDETLVHSSFEAPEIYDFKINFIMNGKKATSYCRKRFGAEYFINEMSKIYELVIFTAATKEYADKVIDVIDSKRRIEHRLYRDSCTQLNKVYLKNLNTLNRKLKNVILLDNSKNSGILQIQNLLLIDSFFDNQKDRELIRLIPFLKFASNLVEIRPVFKKKLCFENREIVIHTKLSNSTEDSSERRKYAHLKKNSEIECLVRKEEDDGTVTDDKLIHAGF